MLARVAMAPAYVFFGEPGSIKVGPAPSANARATASAGQGTALAGAAVTAGSVSPPRATFNRRPFSAPSSQRRIYLSGWRGGRGADSTVSSSRLLVLAARSVLVVGVTVDAVRMVNGEIDATEFGRNTGVGLAGLHNPVTATLSSAYFLNDAFYPGGNNQAGRDFVDEASCVSRTMMGDCYERR